MFRLYFLFIIFILFASLSACEKQQVTRIDFATLQLYGWTPDNSVVVTNFKDGPLEKYSEATAINSYLLSTYMNKFYISQPLQPLAFYAYPDTFPDSHPVLKLDLALEVGEVYSLFLSGTTSSLDTVLVHDKFPVFKTSDSAGAIRFVNLINDAPVSINLKDEPYGSLVQNLPYMAVTDFKVFSAKREVVSHDFEIRDANTNELLYVAVMDDISGELGGNYKLNGKIWSFVFTGFRDGSGPDLFAHAGFQHN